MTDGIIKKTNHSADFDLLKDILEDYSGTSLLDDGVLTEDELTTVIENGARFLHDIDNLELSRNEIEHFQIYGAKTRFGLVSQILEKHGFKTSSLFTQIQSEEPYREAALKKIMDTDFDYKELDPELQNEFEFAFAAVRRNGHSLEKLPPELKYHPDIILEATKKSPLIMGRYLGASWIRHNLDFYLFCVDYYSLDWSYMENKTAIEYLPPNIPNRESVVRQIAGNHKGLLLEHLPAESLNHEEVVEILKKQGHLLEVLSYEQKDTKALVKIALSSSSRAIQYASDRLKNDPELALLSVNQDGANLQYVSAECQNNPEIVLEAVKNYGPALEYASEDIKTNHIEIITEAIKQNYYALKYVPDETKKQYPQFTKLAVEINGRALEYAHSDHKKNYDIVYAAVLENPHALEFADESLQEHRDYKALILLAVKQSGDSLCYASAEMKKDPDVVRAAFESSPLGVFEYMHEDFMITKDMAELVLINSKYGLTYLPEYFKHDGDWLLSLLQQGIEIDIATISVDILVRSDFWPYIIENNDYNAAYTAKKVVQALSKKQLQDPGIAKIFVPEFPLTLECFSDTIRSDPAFVKLAIEQDGKALQYAIGDFNAREEFVLIAIKSNPLSLEFVDTELLKNPEVVIEAIKRNGYAYEYLDPETRNNPQVAVEAVKSHPGYYKILIASLRSNPEIIEYAIQADAENYNYLPSDIKFNDKALTELAQINIHIIKELPFSLQSKVLKNVELVYKEMGYEFESNLFESYANLIAYMKEHTGFPLRFRSLETLFEIVKNNQNLIDNNDERPVALFLISTSDWNTAFESMPFLDRLTLEKTHKVIYKEISSEDDVYSILSQYEDSGKKIQTLFLGGHGTHDSIAFGDKDRGTNQVDIDENNESLYADFQDFEKGEWDVLKDVMANEGKLFLFSCSVGFGGKDKDNMVNRFATVLPEGATVSGSPVPMNIRDIWVDENSEVYVEWTSMDDYNVGGG